MALPPSTLKDLLSTCADANAVFGVLAEARCLNRKAKGNREQIAEIVARAAQKMEAEYADDPDKCGPNRVDFLCDELEEAGVLSSRGRRLAKEMA